MPNTLIDRLTWILRQAGILLYHAGLARLVISLTSRRLRTVLYHACVPEECDYIRGLNVNVTPSTFERHLSYYRKYYNVISIQDVQNLRSKPKSLLITFDDGYASVYEHALPKLQHYGCPAVVYLIGNVIDNRDLVWVNRITCALNRHPADARSILSRVLNLEKRESMHEIMQGLIGELSPQQIKNIAETLNDEMPFGDIADLYLTTEQIDEMRENGVSFGFHTNEHFNLANCTAGDLEHELAISDHASLADARSFAYPFGLFNKHVVQAVRARGYDAIMAVGIDNRRFSDMHIDRVEVFAERPSELFAELEIVEPVLALIRKGWRRLRATDHSEAAFSSTGVIK